jgi:hypothetical protein
MLQAAEAGISSFILCGFISKDTVQKLNQAVKYSHKHKDTRHSLSHKYQGLGYCACRFAGENFVHAIPLQ